MVRKAVILAGGYGTRFLPVTKTIPKEMLSIIDEPAISYVVDECIASGIKDILIVMGRGKQAIEDYFDKNIELETALKNAGKYQELNLIKESAARITYIRQNEMKGTAKAVEKAQSFTQSEPFALLFPDDIMYSEVPVTKQLMDAYNSTRSVIVGVQGIPKEQAVKYGIIDEGEKKGRYIQIKDIIEKPKLAEIKTEKPMTSLGRFILTPDIYDYIDFAKRSDTREIFLPDAIKLLAKNLGAFAYEFEGVRYDTGDKLGFLKCNIEFALRRKDLSLGLAKYLKDLVEGKI